MPNCIDLQFKYTQLITAKHTFDASFSSAKTKDQNNKFNKQSITQATESHATLQNAFTDLKTLFPPELFYPKNPSFTYTTAEGKQETISIEKELAYWSNFYQRNNYHWVNFPKSITLATDQITQMQELMNQGLTKMLIIPENLVYDPQITTDNKGKRTIKNPGYELLHQTASQGYNPAFTSLNYDEDGKFQGSKDKTTSLRIILTKDVQNLDDDELFKATKDLSIEQLEKDPRFSHLLHLTESAYLVHQQEYFKRTGKHLDKNGSTWLPGSERPLSGRVPDAGWYSGVGQLRFGSYPRGFNYPVLGCRLAGSFEVKV